MENIFNELIQVILQIVAAVLVGLACNAVRYGTTWLKNRIKTEKFSTALDELERVVLDGIMHTEQTFVKILKEDNNWSKEVYGEAFSDCYSYVVRNVSTTTKALLVENDNDLADLIQRKIEAQMGKLHQQ